MDEDSRGRDHHIRLAHFRVKLATLAAEKRIIKIEERRAQMRGLNERQGTLMRHRVLEIKPCARLNHLAYGFLKGRSYAEMEHRCKEAPDFDRIKKLARTFCPDRTFGTAWSVGWEKTWQCWVADAQSHLAMQRPSGGHTSGSSDAHLARAAL